MKTFLQILFPLIMVAHVCKTYAQKSFKGNKQNLGKEINDQYEQVQPVFSTDGSTLFFSQGTGINLQLEIWRTLSDSVGRMVGKEKIKALNPNILYPKFLLQSLSSHQLLVSGSYGKYKGVLQYSRGISEFDSQKTPLEFTPNAFTKKPSKKLDSIFKRTNFYPFFHPFFNLYVWSQSNGENGDLYILKAGIDSGKALIKLPKNINTLFSEITPWLDDEGRFLYFASNRPGGLGELDIYVSERLDNSFENWSNPKNAGPLINSVKADFNFIIDPSETYAYFCSTDKTGYGRSDIYRIALQPQDSLVNASPLLMQSDKPDTALQLRPELHLNNNIVFLLDISHSMAQNRKMVLLKKAIHQLIKQYRPADKLSIVIFGSGVEVLLSGQTIKNKAEVMDAIQYLTANGGATNIGAGLQRAYQQANLFFNEEENNQLFVVTDGVFTLKPADEQLAIGNKKIKLTAVIVGNDPSISQAIEPLLTKVGGQLLLITNETADLNLLLQNVRSHANKKNN